MNIYPASLIKNWILDQSKYRIFAWALTLSVIHCTCGFLSRIICFFQKKKRMKNQNQNQPSVFAKQPLRYRVTYHLTHWGLGERVGNLDNQIRSVQDTPLQSHWLIFIHSELKCWHTNLEWQVGSLQSQSPAGECPCQAHRAIRQMRSWNKKKDQSLILSEGGRAIPCLSFVEDWLHGRGQNSSSPKTFSVEGPKSNFKQYKPFLLCSTAGKNFTVVSVLM